MTLGLSRALRRSILRAAAASGALLIGLWVYAGAGRHYVYSGTRMSGRAAPPLDLTAEGGRPFTLASLRGKAVLVYFGYIHCPDVCPMTLMAMKPVFSRLGPASGRVRLVFVTLDPARDDSAALGDYLAGFTPQAIGLTGSPAAIGRAARDWHIAMRKDGANGMIDHSSVLTLVGPDGRVAAVYGPSQLGDPDGLARDLRHVLGGGSSNAV